MIILILNLALKLNRTFVMNKFTLVRGLRVSERQLAAAWRGVTSQLKAQNWPTGSLTSFRLLVTGTALLLEAGVLESLLDNALCTLGVGPSEQLCWRVF